MRDMPIKKLVFYAGPVICWYLAVSVAIVGAADFKSLQRLTLQELTGRIQDTSLSGDDRHQLGKELEDRVPTTIADIENLLSLISKEKSANRQQAINAVSNTVDRSLRSAFVKGLAHKNTIVNAVSASMCGKLKVREAVDGLVGLIKRLGPIGGVVETDKERASIAAVFALGEIGDESKIAFLVGLFGKMRGYEIIALTKYGKKVVPAMLGEIAATDDGYVREQAERVLLSIRDPEATVLFEKEMENPHSPSRDISMRALLNIDPARTLPRILQLWEAENDPAIASLILDHLDHYQISDPSYAPFAEKTLRSSPRSNFRKKASSVLGRIGGEKAKKALKEALKDEDPLVRAFAARSLKRLELQTTSGRKK